MSESKTISTKTQFDLCQERCEMDCEVCKKSRWVSVDVLRQKLQELLKSPFIRTDLEIEIEVNNARKNWKYYKKKGRKGFSDEDFQRILGTRRVRATEIEQFLVGLEPEEAKK